MSLTSNLLSPATLYIAGQLLRLNTALDKDDEPTKLSRYMGGHNRKTQPFISGFHHVFFYLPEMFLTEMFASSRWLTATCETFTPHTSSINTADIIGFGGVGSSIPISRTTNREFTLGFKEYQDLPVLRTIKTWHSLFIPQFGLRNNALPPMLYKATVLVVIKKPSSTNGKIKGSDLEECYIYSGVYPITCPEDSVTASDQSTNETVQASVTFKFDGAPIDMSFPGVETLAVAMMSGESYYDTYEKITKF